MGGACCIVAYKVGYAVYAGTAASVALRKRSGQKSRKEEGAGVTDLDVGLAQWSLDCAAKRMALHGASKSSPQQTDSKAITSQRA